MTKPSVLFIARSYSGNAPRTIRIQNIIKNLTKDYNVHIVAFDYGKAIEESSDHYLHLMKPPLLLKILNKNIFFPSWKNTIKGKLFGLFNFVLEKLLFPDIYIVEKKTVMKKVLELHKKYDFKIIVGVVFPFTTFLIGKELKKTGLDFKLVMDIGDPFAENSALKFTKHTKTKASAYEENTLSYADAIIVTNLATKKMYKDKYVRLKNKKIVVIPQGTNIVENANYSIVDNYGLKLTYAGIFYPKLREPYELFKAIGEWKDKVHLDIYGQSNIYNIDNDKIVFRGKVSHQEIVDIYKRANVLVFMDNAYGLQSSGKIFELLAMKKPILFISDNINSPTYELVKKCNFVFKVKNDASDIKNILEKIKEKKEDYVYDFDMTTVSWEDRSRKYLNLFDSLIVEKKVY